MRLVCKILENEEGGGVAMDIVKCYIFRLTFVLLKVYIKPFLSLFTMSTLVKK